MYIDPTDPQATRFTLRINHAVFRQAGDLPKVTQQITSRLENCPHSNDIIKLLNILSQNGYKFLYCMILLRPTNIEIIILRVCKQKH